MWDINSGDNGLSMFSCMGSQLDMGDRERKALRKVHCTTQQLYIVWLYNKNEVHNYNSAETKMLQSWLYMNDKISQDILNLKILWARRLRKWEKKVTILRTWILLFRLLRHTRICRRKMKNCRYRFCHETGHEMFALFVNSVYISQICKFTHDFCYTYMYSIVHPLYFDQIIQLSKPTHHSSLTIEHF